MTTDQELETFDSEEVMDGELMGEPLSTPYNSFIGLTAAKAAALINKQLG
jgi:hypothetical protein